MTRVEAAAYVGGMALAALYVIDDRFHLRQWKHVHHRIFAPRWPCESFDLNLRARVRPPPIGCADWPAGRVLLQWALHDGGIPRRGATVLEIGSGIGTFAIGLALAARADKADLRATRVIATDVADEPMDNLRANAQAHNVVVGDCALRPVGGCDHRDALCIAKWDAAGGRKAADELPVDLGSVTHIVGADLVYHGGAEADSSTDMEKQGGDNDGLAVTLASLLRLRPDLSVTLLLVDRFSGGTVSALAGAAGVSHPSVTLDPALVEFEARCARLGLRVQRTPVPEHIVRSVVMSQSLLTRASWWLCGTWDGLLLYSIRIKPL